MPTRAEARPVYEKLLATIQITQWGKDKAAGLAKIILGNKTRYQAVETATGVPWQVIAALHHMECSGSFSQHLANGDPIAAPTIHVPAGIPGGTWEECAIAALKYKAWDPALSWNDWLTVLYRAEAYNGFGYWHKHPTPYVWYGTTVCPKKGKYVADGRYDPDAESQQVGVYPILIALGLECLVSYGKSTTQITQRGIMTHAKLVVGQETWLKSSTAQSIDPNADPKVKLVKGIELDLAAQPAVTAGHYEVTLATPYMDIAKGYIWANHAVIQGDDPDVVGEPAKIDKSPKAIQENLIRIGLLDPPADGKRGSQTQSAERAYLRLCGEKSDWDDESLRKLAAHKGIKDLDYRPADPNDPENVLVAKGIKRMVDLGFHVAISMGSDSLAYNLFYIAGVNPDGTRNSNRLDEWNDLRCLVSIDATGLVKKHGVWLATVDAGLYWRGDRRMNDEGALQVDMEKQFLNLSCVGRHGSKQYPALVQVGTLSATRDRTGDGRTADDTIDVGDHFGSNDHHGYDSPNVGIMSAGCCVGKTISGHEKFMTIIKTDRRYKCNNGYAWHRTILDGRKLVG